MTARLARAACPCGEVIAWIDRGDTELALITRSRTFLPGDTREDGERWEYGTASTPPRDGPPPPAGRIHTRTAARPLIDPRSAKDAATVWMNEKLFVRIDTLSMRCPRCQRTLHLGRAAAAMALTKYDATGKVQSFRAE